MCEPKKNKNNKIEIKEKQDQNVKENDLEYVEKKNRKKKPDGCLKLKGRGWVKKNARRQRKVKVITTSH